MVKEEKKEIDPKLKNFGIKIEKINIAVPVIKDVNGADKEVYNKELQKGVAHLKGSAMPGEGSNIFIFGHSSAFIGSGPYSTVFEELDNLKKNDEIIVFYRNEIFYYYVFGKRIVDKKDVSVVNKTDREQLTLMTCWPIGTNEERLIIKAYPK